MGGVQARTSQNNQNGASGLRSPQLVGIEQIAVAVVEIDDQVADVTQFRSWNSRNAILQHRQLRIEKVARQVSWSSEPPPARPAVPAPRCRRRRRTSSWRSGP